MCKEFKIGFSECVVIEFILVAGIVLSTITQQESLVSLLFSISFIIVSLYSIVRIQRKMSLLVISLLATAFFNVLANDFLSVNSNFEFNYFKKLIMFSVFVLLIYYSYRDKVTLKTNKILLYLTTSMGIVLVVSYLFFGNSNTQAGGITLSFANANFTGMWLLHIMIYTFLTIISLKNKLIKSFLLVDIIFLIYLVYLTKARACLISIVVFIVLCLVTKIKKQDLQKKNLCISIILFSPAIFILVYRYLLQSNWFIYIFSFLISEGKGLDSRLAVWNPAIEVLKKHVLLGDYFTISNGTGISQLHNMYLDVFCSYGIIPFVLFSYLLFYISKNIIKNKNFFNRCALYGFFAIIVNGTFEAAIVAGAMGLNILTAGLILLSQWKR